MQVPVGSSGPTTLNASCRPLAGPVPNLSSVPFGEPFSSQDGIARRAGQRTPGLTPVPCPTPPDLETRRTGAGSNRVGHANEVETVGREVLGIARGQREPVFKRGSSLQGVGQPPAVRASKFRRGVGYVLVDADEGEPVIADTCACVAFSRRKSVAEAIPLRWSIRMTESSRTASPFIAHELLVGEPVSVLPGARGGAQELVERPAIHRLARAQEPYGAPNQLGHGNPCLCCLLVEPALVFFRQ